MVQITGGCDRCGRYMTISFKGNSSTPRLICSSCYEKYYSPEAIRDEKLEKLLKKSLYKRICAYFTNTKQ